MIKELKFSLGCGKIKGEVIEKGLKLPQQNKPNHMQTRC